MFRFALLTVKHTDAVKYRIGVLEMYLDSVIIGNDPEMHSVRLRPHSQKDHDHAR
jgi:hypothetical protein